MPRITFAFLCAAVLALLPACSSAGQDDAGASAASTGSSSSGSSSSDSAASESSSGGDPAPRLERSGAGWAGAAQGGQGPLIAPKLPTGANPVGGWGLTVNCPDSPSEVPADMG